MSTSLVSLSAMARKAAAVSLVSTGMEMRMSGFRKRMLSSCLHWSSALKWASVTAMMEMPSSSKIFLIPFSCRPIHALPI